MRFPLRISILFVVFTNSFFASPKLQAQASDGRELLIPILMELALLPEFIPNLFDAFPIHRSDDISNQVSDLNLSSSSEVDTETILNSFMDNLSEEQEHELWLNFFRSIFFKDIRNKRWISDSDIRSDSPVFRTRSERNINPRISQKLRAKIEAFKSKSRNLRILIADDNALNLLALKGKISQIKKILNIEIIVVSVSNGQDVYNRLVEAYDAHRLFDFALLDRNMGPSEDSELNGDIVTERWRHFEQNTPRSENLHIPIFAISTSDSEEICLRRGMDVFLEKGASPLDILDHMLNFLL